MSLSRRNKESKIFSTFSTTKYIENFEINRYNWKQKLSTNYKERQRRKIAKLLSFSSKKNKIEIIYKYKWKRSNSPFDIKKREHTHNKGILFLDGWWWWGSWSQWLHYHHKLIPCSTMYIYPHCDHVIIQTLQNCPLLHSSSLNIKRITKRICFKVIRV